MFCVESGRRTEVELLVSILLVKCSVSGLMDFEDKNFQRGERKRSSFYYDLWNIKYLSKFKWDDLTEEIAKRERDFYLLKVDQFRALSSMEERIKMVIRQFPQKKPVATNTEESKSRLSKDLLAGIQAARGRDFNIFVQAIVLDIFVISSGLVIVSVHV
ncbi:hypothetical protein ACH5RR_026238 [Cinchona calisaya]|uniref:Uncharacterized protein n=1 Tax=Cinchona calisaya TaxID=153742 RepID=A0ABD2Z3X5_9GENT